MDHKNKDLLNLAVQVDFSCITEEEIVRMGFEETNVWAPGLSPSQRNEKSWDEKVSHARLFQMQGRYLETSRYEGIVVAISTGGYLVITKFDTN